MTNRLIQRYIGFQFFFNLLLWLPIFYEYQIRVGLDPAQIFRIQSLYYLAFCLLEIPTGLIADRLGYLRCVRAGAIVLVLANLLPVIAPNYSGFLAHFMLIALARSLISGASSAYLYDALAIEGETSRYKEIEGRARAYGLIGKVLCWSGIGVAMNWHLTLPYTLTTVSAVISIFYAFSLPRLPLSVNVDPSAQTSELHRQIREAIGMVAARPFLFLVMLQGVGIFVLGRIVQVNLFQPILTAKTFGVASLGWIMSLMTVFEAAGSYVPASAIWRGVRKKLSDLSAVHLFTIGMALSLGILPLVGKWGALAALAIFSTVVGISFPIQKQLMNDAIEGSSFRATLLSLESIVDRAVCAWVAACLGKWMTDPSGLNTFIFGATATTLAVIAILYLFFHFTSSSAKKATAL